MAVIAEEPKQAFSSQNLGAALPGSPLLTLADCDSPSNGGKSSSAHLRKQKRILLGEDLGVIIQCYHQGYHNVFRCNMQASA